MAGGTTWGSLTEEYEFKLELKHFIGLTHSVKKTYAIRQYCALADHIMTTNVLHSACSLAYNPVSGEC